MNPALLKSQTFWGGFIYLALDYAQKSGLIPTGTSESISLLVQNVAGLAAIWGLRRRLPTP